MMEKIAHNSMQFIECVRNVRKITGAAQFLKLKVLICSSIVWHSNLSTGWSHICKHTNPIDTIIIKKQIAK